MPNNNENTTPLDREEREDLATFPERLEKVLDVYLRDGSRQARRNARPELLAMLGEAAEALPRLLHGEARWSLLRERLTQEKNDVRMLHADGLMDRESASRHMGLVLKIEGWFDEIASPTASEPYSKEQARADSAAAVAEHKAMKGASPTTSVREGRRESPYASAPGTYHFEERERREEESAQREKARAAGAQGVEGK